MKKIVVFLLMIALMMTNLGAVLADTVSSPSANQISNNLNYASVEWKNTDNSATSRDIPSISYVKASIRKSSSTSVTISATTESSITAQKIGGRMNLQRWIDNKWTTYKSYAFWSYNTSHASATRTVTVPSGYYYRLKVSHVAINGSGTDSVVSTTSSTLVN